MPAPHVYAQAEGVGVTVTKMPGFTRQDLARRFAELGFTSGAEVGVRQGAFSLALCRAIPKLHLLCVDPWCYYPANPKMYAQDRHDVNYAVAKERLKPYDAVLVKATSMDAVAYVPEGALDFVYIDGNHELGYVLNDLTEWSRRVRAGGIVSGDDYDAPGVQQALHCHARQVGIEAIWLTEDPQRRNRKGDVFTSWWFVKP